MSTREELAENLTAYIDGELSELEVKRLEDALKSNPELAALERQLRAAAAGAQKLTAPQPSPSVRRAVLNRIAEKTLGEKVRAMFTLPRLVPVAGLAAAAAVTVVVARGSRPDKPAMDTETLYVAQNMDLIEDLDVLGLENPDDLDLVTQLHELEVTP